MSQQLWTAVDEYMNGLFVPRDKALSAGLKASDAAGLPQIQVTPTMGKFLYLLAKLQGAKRILEIGTLGGYSTTWLARALPPRGKLITLEYEPKHARVAGANLKRAGVADKVQIVVGKALESLPKLAAKEKKPFDLFFIDADKQSNADYFKWALKLSRPGSLIIVDNVVRSGAVIDAGSKDEAVQGVRKFNKVLAKEKRVTATQIQTVGSKGYDGIAIALVNK